jgi:hypothetical protein
VRRGRSLGAFLAAALQGGPRRRRRRRGRGGAAARRRRVVALPPWPRAAPPVAYRSRHCLPRTVCCGKSHAPATGATHIYRLRQPLRWWCAQQQAVVVNAAAVPGGVALDVPFRAMSSSHDAHPGVGGDGLAG